MRKEEEIEDVDDKGLNGIVKQEIEEKEVVITKQQETEERNVGSETHLLVDTPSCPAHASSSTHPSKLASLHSTPMYITLQ